MELTTEKKPKKTAQTVIFMTLLASVVAAGVIYFTKDAGLQSTDDAQTDGNIVPIRAGVTGYISKIYFTDNQLVKKGDTLITFTPTEFQAKVLQAEAALESATSNREATQSKVKVSEDNSATSVLNIEVTKESINGSKAALEKAQTVYNRTNELLKVKGATQEQLDNARAALQIAQSDYNRALDQQRSAESNVNSVKSQVNSDRSQVNIASSVIKQREAELILVKEQLTRVVVIAPCNGVVSKRSVQEGQFVSTGQALCSIIDSENLWVTANLKETQLKDIKIGQPVEIVLDAYPELKLTGKVAAINGATGAKFSLFPPDNATGNFIKVTQRFPLKISIDNLPGNEVTLFPGLSAFVKIKTK